MLHEPNRRRESARTAYAATDRPCRPSFLAKIETGVVQALAGRRAR
jgi:hypothetical protein